MRLRDRLVAVFVLLCVNALPASGTALDDYVNKPDASYQYEVARTLDGPGWKAYVIDMISQTWRSEEEVDRTQWQHWLTVVVPEEAKYDTAMLWINGGSNGKPAPSNVDSMLAALAMGSNSVVADLKTVPNQPLKFPDGGRPRYEDGIIAYTFAKYVQTGDKTWPLLLPMVKSAVRAMDTIQSAVAKATDGDVKIEKFVVGGGSKRGWTTWLTGAVDKRVCGITPAVIDVLNMDEQMRHHFAAYGFYSSAIGDYEDMNIFGQLDTPPGQELISFVDPYEYRERYTMPKFMVNSSGDQFFLPDSSQFYWKDLPPEKYIRYCPNTDHGLGGSDADKSLLAFYKSILEDVERPVFSWRVTERGAIAVRTRTEPAAVKLWHATNPEARDFRLETIGKAWQSRELKPREEDRYVGRVKKPEKGFTAFFVELTFDSGFAVPYKFTTQVKVVPDVLPFAEKLEQR